MSELRGLGLQELAPRRSVEEEVSHLHGGTRLAGCGDRCRVMTLTIPIDAPAMLLSRRPGHEAQAGHGADARQGLAPETEAGDPLEILEARDLAGGMARQRQGQFCLG